MRFRPRGRGVPARWGAVRFPRSAVAFPGVPWRFLRSAERFRRDAAAFPPDGGRGMPRVPRAAVLTGLRRKPAVGFSQACYPIFGPPVTDCSSATPAGGQPLTSGPARVRLIRRMTRCSRSIAAR